VRTIDEILADMQAIMAKPDGEMTADDVLAYQALELELAQVQEAAQPDEATEGETEPEAPMPAAQATGRTARTAAIAAARTRHNGYTRVVVPAGRPSNRGNRETENDGFRAYLRSGRENADLTRYNAQGTGTDSAGGFTVPEDFRAKLIEVQKSYGGVLNAAEQLPTTDGRSLPYPTIDDTSNTSAIAAENTAPASGGADLVFGEVRLGAWEYNATGAGNTPLALPRALVQDSAVDIEGKVSSLLGTRLARKMAVDAVNGSAASQPEGLIHNITGLEIVGTALAYSDIVSLVMSLDKAYWTNAKFYCNQASLGKIMELEDTNGNLIFRQTVTVSNGAPAVLATLAIGPLVVPVELDNDLADIDLTTGQGTVWGVFGDVQQGYVWRQVRDIEILVDPYSANDKRQIKYNAWVRADGAQQNTAAYKAIAGHTP
jgi:HK97 family phage major capsid protein